MIASKFYLRKNLASGIGALLQSMPREMRPTHFSDSEERLRSKDVVTDTSRFEEFVDENPLGFFLVSPQCKYDLALVDSEFSVVTVCPTQEIMDASSCFENLLSAVGAEAEFGFACSDAESRHCNFFSMNLGDAKMDVWVGLNLKSFVPGVFWRTYIAKNIIVSRSIDLAALPKCVTARPFFDRGVTLSEEVAIQDWSLCREEIDKYVDAQPAFFSIQRMLAALPPSANLPGLIQGISRWR
jgi:hypothetical protein